MFKSFSWNIVILSGVLLTIPMIDGIYTRKKIEKLIDEYQDVYKLELKESHWGWFQSKMVISMDKFLQIDLNIKHGPILFTKPEDSRTPYGYCYITYEYKAPPQIKAMFKLPNNGNNLINADMIITFANQISGHINFPGLESLAAGRDKIEIGSINLDFNLDNNKKIYEQNLKIKPSKIIVKNCSSKLMDSQMSYKFNLEGENVSSLAINASSNGLSVNEKNVAIEVNDFSFDSSLNQKTNPGSIPCKIKIGRLRNEELDLQNIKLDTDVKFEDILSFQKLINISIKNNEPLKTMELSKKLEQSGLTLKINDFHIESGKLKNDLNGNIFITKKDRDLPETLPPISKMKLKWSISKDWIVMLLTQLNLNDISGPSNPNVPPRPGDKDPKQIALDLANQQMTELLKRGWFTDENGILFCDIEYAQKQLKLNGKMISKEEQNELNRLLLPFNAQEPSKPILEPVNATSAKKQGTTLSSRILFKIMG